MPAKPEPETVTPEPFARPEFGVTVNDEAAEATPLKARTLPPIAMSVVTIPSSASWRIFFPTLRSPDRQICGPTGPPRTDWFPYGR